MKEDNQIQINPENDKNTIDTSTRIDLSTNPLPPQKTAETLTIKPKQPQSQFELYIVNAYKKLVGFQEQKPGEQPKEKQEQIKLRPEEEERRKINECELELRKALEEITNTQNIFLNKNIIDKTTRIAKRNIINLSLIIGQIYIVLMGKKNLFSKLNYNNNLNKNIIISFINEVINMNSLLRHTYLCIKYDNSLFDFLENVIKEIPFDSEQLNEINIVLQEHKNRKQEKKLNTNTSKEFLDSINLALNKQNSLYGQYKVILDNCEGIIELINKGNTEDSEEVKNFFQFEIMLTKLFFGKKCVLMTKKNSEDDNQDKNFTKKLFDGFEDNSQGNINVILGENFLVDYDEDLEPMRENLCQIIIKFSEKFKVITNLIEFQYSLFILLKRVYFYHFKKYENELLPILVEVLINLCKFQDKEKINSVVQFINSIINSKNENDAKFKDLLTQKIEENKNNENFHYNKDNIAKNLEDMQNNSIYVEETNLNIGFFTDVQIESGESLDLYVELSKPFGYIDFSLIVKRYDINLTIINLTEGKMIYQEKKLKSDKTPFKLNLFFTKPGIFKIKLDNTYSWLRDKHLSYKVTTFYPQYPKIFENKVSISKYQELLNNTKKLNGTKVANDHNLDIIQDDITYTYNLDDIKKNIEIINSMIEAFQIKVLSIYLNTEKEEGKEEKKYFYFEKENLEKLELTKENFDKFIKDNKNDKGKTIINLFIVTGDAHEFLNIKDLSFQNVLGFEPILSEGDNAQTDSILYFIQYYNQAQLIYYLCNNSEEQQNTLLINYTKFGGYQIGIYVNGEIISECKDLEKINKNEFLENNIDIIGKLVKKLAKDNNKIKILVTDSIDTEENNITADKMEETLKKSLEIKEGEEGNYKIVKLNKESNKNLEKYNHLFNLIE